MHTLTIKLDKDTSIFPIPNFPTGFVEYNQVLYVFNPNRLPYPILTDSDGNEIGVKYRIIFLKKEHDAFLVNMKVNLKD